MYKLLVLTALLGVAYAGGKYKCPMTFGKYPMDEQKMSGDWYMLAGTPVLNKDRMRCTKFNYQLSKDVHMIEVNAINKDGKPVKREVYGQSVFGKDKQSGLLMTVWKKDDGSFSSVLKQSIVATDYENYAVFIACKPIFDENTKTFGRHIKAGILSRKQTLSQETMDVLKNVLSGYDIEPETILPIDHLNC